MYLILFAEKLNLTVEKSAFTFIIGQVKDHQTKEKKLKSKRKRNSVDQTNK